VYIALLMVCFSDVLMFCIAVDRLVLLVASLSLVFPILFHGVSVFSLSHHYSVWAMPWYCSLQFWCISWSCTQNKKAKLLATIYLCGFNVWVLFS